MYSPKVLVIPRKRWLQESDDRYIGLIGWIFYLIGIYQRVLHKNIIPLKRYLSPCTLDWIKEKEIGSKDQHMEIEVSTRLLINAIHMTVVCLSIPPSISLFTF